MKRWDTRAAVWRGGALVLLSLAVLGSGCAGRRAPPARGADASPVATPALVPAEAIKADLVQLYETLQRAHFNLYARVTKEAYDQHYAAMLASIERPASRDEIAAVLGRFVAFGKVAHARIDEGYDAFDRYQAAGGTAFPLSLRIRGARVFVADNLGERDDIHPGDEIIALDGEPIATWLERAARDVAADTPYMAHALMERDFPGLLWLELGPAETFAVTLRDAAGGKEVKVLAARTTAQTRASAQVRPRPFKLSRSERIVRMLDRRTAYLRPGPFYNSDPGAADPYDNTAFRHFVDSAFHDLLGAGADRLLIDLRDNPGGDSSFSDLMVSWFADRPFRFTSAFQVRVSAEAIASNDRRLAAEPADGESVSRKLAAAYARARPGDVVDLDVPLCEPRPEPRFKGRVYVLVNRRSYSNAVAVAALVQDYGFGMILGEETSDLATTFGAMETFQLPRTGLVVGFPKAFIVRPSGELAPRGVVPDIAIETPVVEGVDDPVLARALQIVAAAP
jgi:C-terminal processing protease CtpA/Prc